MSAKPNRFCPTTSSEVVIRTCSGSLPGGASWAAASELAPAEMTISRNGDERARSVHDEAAVDAERLARHVAGLRRGQEPDDVRDVLRCLHASERHGVQAGLGEIIGAHAE